MSSGNVSSIVPAVDVSSGDVSSIDVSSGDASSIVPAVDVSSGDASSIVPAVDVSSGDVSSIVPAVDVSMFFAIFINIFVSSFPNKLINSSLVNIFLPKLNFSDAVPPILVYNLILVSAANTVLRINVLEIKSVQPPKADVYDNGNIKVADVAKYNVV